MVRPIYSKLLFAAYPAANGITNIGGPPSPNVWDVRNVVVWNGNPWYQTASGFWLADAGGSYIVRLTKPDVFNGRMYSFDVRQIVPQGDTLNILCGDSSWSVRISGYELTGM